MVSRLVRVTAGGTPRVIDLLRVASVLRPRGVFAVAGDGDSLVFWDETQAPGVPHTVTASTGQTATGTSSPITIAGLANATPVTFTVATANSPESWATDPVTPTAGSAGVVYYVDAAAGSDSNTGTSPAEPLASLAAAMAADLGPGDAVLLKRGSTWPGETFGSPDRSGAENRPITIAAYGQGNQPMLYGGEQLTGWETYETQATNPELLQNAAMETFGVSGAQTIPVNWHVFVGSGGGTVTKESTIVDTGSTGAARMTFGGGTNILDQTVTVSAGIEYEFLSRIATNPAGVTAGAGLQITVRAGATGAYRYLQSDGTWTSSTAFWGTVIPGTTYATTTVTFTPETDGPLYVEFSRVATAPIGGWGFAVFIDNCSIKTANPAPNSPNTYRCPLTRSTGSYPGILYRDRGYLARGLDKDRLPNGSWLYDGTHMYYRQDAGSPSSDGATYEVAAVLDGIALDHRTDWVVRDLEWHLFNRHAANAADSSRIVFAENTARQVGCQTLYTGIPANPNGVFGLSLVVDGTLRGNDARGCHTDLFYGVGTTNISVIDNVGILAHGEAADCLQIDHAGAGTPLTGPNAFGVYVARNHFDNRNTPSPKGCIIIFANEGVIEDNWCAGGHFGISVPGLDHEVRHNRIYEVGVADHTPWTAGIYSENNGADSAGAFIHHNLIVGCENGMNFASGRRSGYRVYHNTIVGSAREGIELSVTWNAADPSEFANNLLWNPEATAGEGLPTSTTGLTVETNLAGENPLFVDNVAYVPGPGSPAIDAGTVIPGVNDGYTGSAPDVGYVEQPA